MEESTIYQMIFERGKKVGHTSGVVEGRVEGLAEGRIEGRMDGRVLVFRQLLLRQGTKKFGAPTAAVIATLDSIRERERLEDLADHLLDVSTWDELLTDS